MTPDQILLVSAALRDDADARAAWREVRPRLDLDELEPGSFALMPLIYRRLEAWGDDDPLLPRLKGLYRHTWYRNQLLLSETEKIAAATADLDVLVAGGPLLVSRYYDEGGLRPTDRVDLVAQPAQTDSVATVLERLEWKPLDGTPSRARTAHWYSRAERQFAVVRAPLLPTKVPVWEHADEVEVGREHARGLCAAHQLLWICIGSDRLESWGRVQWVADADALIRSGRVDWERFVADAGAARSSLAVATALRSVRQLAGSPVSDAALAELDAQTPAAERLRTRLPARLSRRLARLPRSL